MVLFPSVMHRPTTPASPCTEFRPGPGVTSLWPALEHSVRLLVYFSKENKHRIYKACGNIGEPRGYGSQVFPAPVLGGGGLCAGTLREERGGAAARDTVGPATGGRPFLVPAEGPCVWTRL